MIVTIFKHGNHKKFVVRFYLRIPTSNVVTKIIGLLSLSGSQGLLPDPIYLMSLQFLPTVHKKKKNLLHLDIYDYSIFKLVP